jgi:cytochrome P450
MEPIRSTSLAGLLERFKPGSRPGKDIPRLEPGGPPWLGRGLSIAKHPGALLLDGYHRYGPIFRYRTFGMNLVALIGPEANELIMFSARESFSHEGGYEVLQPVMGKNLLTIDGEAHRSRRLLMNQGFGPTAVREYFGLMVQLTKEHVERWPRSGVEPMFERMARLTFDVMARLILGTRGGDAELDRLSKLARDFSNGTAFAQVPLPFSPYWKGLKARKELTRYVKGVLVERRHNPGSDVLGRLIEAWKEDSFTQDDLIEEIIMVMFAGHEPSTSLLTSFILALGRQPQLMRELEAEQLEVVGDGELRVEHLARLPKLDAMFKEIERFWPPIPMQLRKVVKPVEFGGYSIPVGTRVVGSPWASHRLDEAFRDPGVFDPSRFDGGPRDRRNESPTESAGGGPGSGTSAKEERQHKKPYLIGFGGGARLCIGRGFARQHAMVVASALLRNYSIELETCRPKLDYFPILQPKCGLPGRVKERDLKSGDPTVTLRSGQTPPRADDACMR